jgi:hypothetical protein
VPAPWWAAGSDQSSGDGFVATREVVQIDPDVGIPDLIRRLADDSKRLAKDEVRLAKLEMGTSIHEGARGAIWLGLAFGAGVVTLVALTIALIALIGRALGHYWAGALIVAVVELVAAFLLLRFGLSRFRRPSYTFEESRDTLRETVDWARTARVH